MASSLILETDIIDVTNPPVLIFGSPGSGKTSMACTAKNPLVLDFDSGLHRSAFRKTGMRFDNWEDVLAEQRAGRFSAYETIVLDTVGTLLEYATTSIVNSGMQGVKTRSGSLSQTGWGVLKTTFGQWLAGLRQAGKQIIMLAHQKEEKDGDMRMLRPDIAGGSYGIVMNCSDIVGYLSYRNNARFLSFDPTDSYFAKNGAGLTSGPVPDFTQEPNFMAKLLEKAKANLGHTAQASAAVAKVIEEWSVAMDNLDDIDALNKILPELGKMGRAEKVQAWAIIQQTAERHRWTFQKETKKFVDLQADPALAQGIS